MCPEKLNIHAPLACTSVKFYHCSLYVDLALICSNVYRVSFVVIMQQSLTCHSEFKKILNDIFLTDKKISLFIAVLLQTTKSLKTLILTMYVLEQ